MSNEYRLESELMPALLYGPQAINIEQRFSCVKGTPKDVDRGTSNCEHRVSVIVSMLRTVYTCMYKRSCTNPEHQVTCAIT
jgi:hypothetical protein